MKHLAALPRSLRFFAEPFENWIAFACLISGTLAAAGVAGRGGVPRWSFSSDHGT